jgi:class 3 adenylate cyclase
LVANERVERRLTAILVADVAGYSRLMHQDEEGTHARFTGLMADAVLPAITQHGGRIGARKHEQIASRRSRSLSMNGTYA